MQKIAREKQKSSGWTRKLSESCLRRFLERKYFCCFYKKKTRVTWRARPVVDCVALSSLYALLTKNFRHWVTTQF